MIDEVEQAAWRPKVGDSVVYKSHVHFIWGTEWSKISGDWVTLGHCAPTLSEMHKGFRVQLSEVSPHDPVQAEHDRALKARDDARETLHQTELDAEAATANLAKRNAEGGNKR